MSGICGAVALDGRPVPAGSLGPVLDRLAGLGPDGTGSWSGAVGPLGVALGAARRRRVDEDAADDQPVADDDRGLVAVGDVVLDNRPELCRALGLPDTSDLTDLAVVVAAYWRWGEACAGRLLGDVAVAVADRGRGGVLLVRDHLGRRPLHVHEAGGLVAFASTALAVTGFDHVPAVLDEQRVRDFVALVMDSDRSWVRDVRPVPPATTVWIGPDGTRRRRYWELTLDVDTGTGFDGHVEALRAAFDQAVAAAVRRIPRGTPAGVMLSGGLDSTAVAATVARLVDPGPVRTYTQVPPPGWTGPADGDERPYVQAMAARHPNLRPTFLDTRGLSLLDGLDGLYARGATPARNTTNGLWSRALRQEAAADGVATLFTGGVGNLAFSADDPAWLAALLRRGRVVAAGRELAAWTARRSWRSGAAALARGVAPALVDRAWDRPRQGTGSTGDWLSATALRPDLHATVDLTQNFRWPDPRGILAGMGGAAEWQAVEYATWGLRMVDPTADVRVLEVAARQPPWVRRHDGWDRAACRAAMADRLPDEVRLRRTRGIQLADWWERLTELRPEIEGHLAATADHPGSRAVLDVHRLTVAMGSWPASAPERGDRATWTYRLALPRALAVSGYLRWFEREAGRPPRPGPVPAGIGAGIGAR